MLYHGDIFWVLGSKIWYSTLIGGGWGGHIWRIKRALAKKHGPSLCPNVIIPWLSENWSKRLIVIIPCVSIIFYPIATVMVRNGKTEFFYDNLKSNLSVLIAP